MTLSTVEALPQAPGAYRWYYADVVSGDTTAVFIFLVGSLFSARYAARARHGARPVQHCAVNFALYQAGVRRQWVLSEYAEGHAEAASLRIGDSWLRYRPDGTLECFIRARTTPFGAPTKAHLLLVPEGPGREAAPLVPGLTHRWAPLAVRARATLRLPMLGRTLEGRGYHDSNAGEVPLGGDLPRWTWARVHGATSTSVQYWLPAGQTLSVHASEGSCTLSRGPAEVLPVSRTGWGLHVPTTLQPGEGQPRPVRLLESSPFYARLESHGTEGHALAEVADFRRFHSPLIRWMAHFRTRVERAA